MPVLPFYAESLGADGTTLGLIFVAYAAAQFACAPLWGRLSDRVGRRPVLLATIAGTAASLALLGFADSLVGIAAARLLGGAFAANVSVASAYITDVTAESERTRWMGLLGASFGVGFVLGPAIGGALAPLGYAVPMLAAAGLAAANWLHAVVSLREPARHAAASAGRGRLAGLRDPVLRRLCLANLAFTAAVTQLEVLFAFFMLHRFGWDAHQVAFILVGMALVMGGVQGGGMRALAARFPERRLVIAGSALLAVALAALPFAPSVGWLLVPLTAAALGRAVVQPALLSLAASAAEAGARGAALGTFQSSASLARVLGPLVAGVLYDASRPAPFLLAAGLLVGVAGGARVLPEHSAGLQAAPAADEFAG
jgi:MFS family permease